MTRTRTLVSADEASALEELHAAGATDGLPVVIPTTARVDRMVLAGGLDPDVVVGEIGPGFGVATVEKIAINTVMAGCVPDWFPIVLAAVRAVCDPVFDLTEIQATTHSVAPIIIVNGPVRSACSIASGFGALGPGHRANASIGRALRLVMHNIGGARPGVSDMALLGHPGKFTYCLGELEEESPWPPLHVARGFEPGESTVTVVGVEAPHSVIASLDADDPDAPEQLLGVLGATAANLGSNNAYFSGNAVIVVVLNPDHAHVLAGAGLDRYAVCNGIARHAANPRGRLRALNRIVAEGPDDELVPAVRDAGDIVLVVAGGTGLYSAVMPSWGGGAHQNPAVTVAIELDQVCELPSFSSRVRRGNGGITASSCAATREDRGLVGRAADEMDGHGKAARRRDPSATRLRAGRSCSPWA